MKYILFLFLLLILSQVFAQQVKPLLKLAKGETYYMSSSGTSAITQSTPGRENKVNLALSFVLAFKVTGITDTIYTMEAHYVSIDMMIHMGDTSVTMSSEQKPAAGGTSKKLDTASLLMAAMVNKPFGIALSVKGKILSVKNLDNIITGAFANFSLIDPSKKELIKNQFMQSFGEGAFKGILETGIAIFPGYAVAKNDKWTVNSTLSAPATVNVKTVYRLADVTADILVVHGEGIIAPDESKKPGVTNNMAMKYNLNGGLVTDIKIDRQTGWLSELKVQQLMEGNIVIKDSPETPGGMTIPMMLKTDVITTGNKHLPEDKK